MAEQDNSSSSMMWKAILVAVVLMAVIVPFSFLSKSGGKAANGDEAEQRIVPVARVEFAKVAAAGGVRSGEQIYNSICVACHGSGAAGAPKKGDKAAWAPRIGQGIDALVKSAIAGKGAMPPKGGAADLTDAELKATIEYLTK